MPWISAAVGIKDSADAPINIVGQPFFLKLGAGLQGTFAPNGASVGTVTITSDGIALGAVDDIAALAIYPAASLDNGAVLGMASVRDRWELVWSSPSTPDDITVVAAAGVAGANWHRLCEASTYWLFQSEWHVNPSSGDDENGGASAGDSIATWAEMRRRVGNFAVSAIIYVYDDLPASDPVRPPRSGSTSYNLIEGVASEVVIASGGTFTAVTAAVPATDTRLTLTDAALPANWNDSGPAASSLLYLRVRIVGGARDGAIGQAVKDIGGKAAEFTSFLLVDTSSPLATSFTSVTPQVGDAYVVESVPTINIVFDEPTSGSYADGNYCRVVFSAINVNEEDVPYVPRFGFPQAVTFIGCDVGYTCGSYYAFACIGNGVLFRGGETHWYAGAFIPDAGVVTVAADAVVELGQGATVQAGLLDVWGVLAYTDAGGACVFDSPAQGIVIESGGLVYAAASNAPLWGDGNTTYGVTSYKSTSLIYDGTVPRISGTTNDVNFAGTAHPWADFPIASAFGAIIATRG